MPDSAILLLGAPDGEVALLGALSVAPAILTGLALNCFIDRARKRPLLIATDLVRAVLVASIPLAAWLGGLSMVQLYIVAFLTGAATALFQIADQSFLPSVVGRADLAEGNTKLAATELVAEYRRPGPRRLPDRVSHRAGRDARRCALDSCGRRTSLRASASRRCARRQARNRKAPGPGWARSGAIPYLPGLPLRTHRHDGLGLLRRALHAVHAARAGAGSSNGWALIIGAGGIGAFIGAGVVGPSCGHWEQDRRCCCSSC